MKWKEFLTPKVLNCQCPSFQRQLKTNACLMLQSLHHLKRIMFNKWLKQILSRLISVLEPQAQAWVKLTRLNFWNLRGKTRRKGRSRSKFRNIRVWYQRKKNQLQSSKLKWKSRQKSLGLIQLHKFKSSNSKKYIKRFNISQLLSNLN